MSIFQNFTKKNEKKATYMQQCSLQLSAHSVVRQSIFSPLDVTVLMDFDRRLFYGFDSLLNVHQRLSENEHVFNAEKSKMSLIYGKKELYLY